MSLTSIFNQKTSKDKEITTFLRSHLPTASDFHTVSGNQPFSTKEYTLHVENQLAKSHESSQLGTAFDYLFRLDIANQTKQPFNLNQVVAMKGHKMIKERFPNGLFYDIHFMSAKTRMESHMHTTSVTTNYHRNATKIYGACFLFAQLELVYRSNVRPEKLNKDWLFLPKGSFIGEFEQLQALAQKQVISQLSPEDTITYNPNFGLGSGLVRGADADIVINNTLIDVKTTKNPGYRWKDIAQLVGYYFLNRINAKYGTTVSLNFSKVALYKARFGEMETIDLGAFYGDRVDQITEDLYDLLQ